MSEHTLHKILSNISCLPKNNYKLLLAGRSEPALNKNYENILLLRDTVKRMSMFSRIFKLYTGLDNNSENV
jgi:hypothetical protein